MTVTREELLRAAYASGDDTERLVYADWLEQHGEVARAQVIHLQCELATTPPHERRHVELQWEIEAVLAELGTTWTSELPLIDGVEWIELERGLPSAVRVRDVGTLIEHADEIVGAAPTIHTVELQRLEAHDAVPPMPWLRTLRIAGAMAYGPLLSVPRELVLDIGVYQAPDFEREGDVPLEKLEVRNNNEGGEELAAMLAGAEWARGLRTFSCPTRWVDEDTGYGPANDPRLGQPGASALAKLVKLEALNVDRQVSPKPLEKLFALPALRELSARECGGVTGFHKATKGAMYRRLDVSRNRLDSNAARTLATAPRLAELERLELDTCELDAFAFQELVRAPMWQHLRYLDISRNPIGASGIRALADAPKPARLHTLLLADADLDEAAATALGKIAWLGDLLALDISGNKLGRGTAALRSIVPDHVRKLVISSIGMERTEATFLSRFWPKLVHLDLANNAITDAGLERFAATKEAPSLQTLRLRDCKLGDDGLDLLAQRGRCPRLRSLDLAGNAFNAPAIEALLRAPIASRLTSLDLSRCDLSTDSVHVLARAPLSLQRLELRGNVLTERDLLILAESPTLRRVTEIKMDGNPWSFEASVRERLAERFGPLWYQHPEDG